MQDATNFHIPVMLDEVLGYLVTPNSRLVVDATAGAGGHARAIMNANPAVHLIAIDRDPSALDIARVTLAEYANRVTFVHANYAEVGATLREAGGVDGVLLDLGVSSMQLDTAGRGFSYGLTGPLNMSMSQQGMTALEFIRGASHEELTVVMKKFGEVRRAGRIARSIKKAADGDMLGTTRDLKVAIESGSGGYAPPGRLSQVFQAIRIAVNDELDSLEKFLNLVPVNMNRGARLVTLSYHSLEDRMIKEFMKRESTDCLCPPSVPVCSCDHKAILKVLTRRVVRPARAEVEKNPRARSARLRAVEFLTGELS